MMADANGAFVGHLHDVLKSASAGSKAVQGEILSQAVDPFSTR